MNDLSHINMHDVSMIYHVNSKHKTGEAILIKDYLKNKQTLLEIK